VSAPPFLISIRLNHEALKALIVAQHAQILSKTNTGLARRRDRRLKLLIAKLRRMQFGGKSEKAGPADRAGWSARWTNWKRAEQRDSFYFRYLRRLCRL